MSPTDDSDSDYDTLRQAVYAHCESETRNMRKVTKAHEVSIGRLRLAFGAWNMTEAQPLSWNDVQSELPSVGRLCKVTSCHEKIIAQGVRH